MSRLLLLTISFFPLITFSQQKLDKNKADVKKMLEAFVLENKAAQAVWQETEGRLVLNRRDAKGNMLKQEYNFDEGTGNCTAERTFTSCEACFRQQLEEILALRSFEWKKINESQYISKFSDYVMIELQEDGREFSISLLKTAWTRELYDLLMKDDQ